MEHFEVDAAVIEYEVRGQGEPVLLIAPSLTADGLGVPLFTQPELASHYQLIHYHRRGYMGSTLGSEPLTISKQAKDAGALLRYLGVKSAHIAGHSLAGNIALQMAVDVPGQVHSLALLEPSLPMVPSGKVSLEHNVFPAVNAYRAGHKQQAIEIFGDNIFGPNWQSFLEHAIPGGFEQAAKDLDTFMQELSLMQEWQFGPRQAGMIRQPVLSVLGVLRPNLFMEEGRALLHTWLPQTEDLDVNTTHLLQMQDPQGVAHGLTGFFGRHPMK